jgi:hypothetical protein
MIINPTLEIPFTRVLGMYFGAPIIINKDRFLYGVEIGFILGNLTKKKATNS